MRVIMKTLLDIRETTYKHDCQRAGQPVDARVLETYKASYKAIDSNLAGFVEGRAEGRMQEAMTTGDFPFAIGEFVNRLLVPGYEQRNFNFEPLVWNDTLTNYLPHDRYQKRSQLDDLEYTPPGGTARVTAQSDATKRQYQVHDFKKALDFNTQALVNDDLGYFEDTALDMGRSARRTLEKFVSRMYTNATTIARLQGLGVLFSQTGRMTSERISEARMGFNQRVDDKAEPIHANMAYIVYHRGDKDKVFQIQNSQLVPETDLNGVNKALSVPFIAIEDPYITGAAPNLPWYAFTNWATDNIRPFVLARMQGRPGPFVLRKKENKEVVASVLGSGGTAPILLGNMLQGNLEFEVHDVWGTFIDGVEGSLFDNRGAYYSSGTTV